MASGQFVTAKLMRSNGQTPWGFRLQGGQEFQMPLSMVKVSEGSLAEQAGVQVGDIILKINGKECDTLKHKEAQDAIINAGNYLELYLERAPMNTWKPTVIPVGNIDIRNKSKSTEPQTYTKTSLAKSSDEYSGIGSGHNSTAKPFGAGAAGGGGIGGPKLVHKQFNSPINLYSEKSLEETLNAHAEVLSSGATGINFMRPDAPVNKESAVFQMVQEEEMRKAKGISSSPEKNGFHDGVGGQDGGGPIRHVQAPSGGPSPQKQDDRNRNICAHCERLIVGVFVRINNKSLHADCFVCSTCGTSLKNIGYFNINDKLYCDIHARQIRQVLGDSATGAGGQCAMPLGQSQPGFTNSGYPGATPAGAVGIGNHSAGGPSSTFGQHISPPQPSVTQIPVQTMNSSYQSSNLTSSHNGFQTFSQAPKKFSPVAPPTAPKPNFTPNQNRNSMYASNPPSSYNYSSQETVSQKFAPSGAALNNPAAVAPSFTSISITRNQNQMASPNVGGQQQQRPKSCYSSLPGAYSVTTNTYESRTTTTNFGGGPSSTNATNNLPYPKTATQYASSQTTTYSMPPPPSAAVGPTAFNSNSLPSTYPGAGPAASAAPSAPSSGSGVRPITNSISSTTTTTQQQQQQTSFGKQNLVTDSTSVPKRGKGFLQSQLTGGVIPFCGYCSQPIRGQYIMALNKTWCPNHFVCANALCKRSLEQNGFVEEQGRLYCENCYETHFAPTCTKCHQRIKGDCLNALDKQWHPECFTCTHCRKPFGNSSFYLEDSFPYCEKDWNDLFTTKCVGCGYPIAAGDRWVEALNQNYHSNCFRCSVCGGNLEGQSFFAKGGRPYCKAHAR